MCFHSFFQVVMQVQVITAKKRSGGSIRTIQNMFVFLHYTPTTHTTSTCAVPWSFFSENKRRSTTWMKIMNLFDIIATTTRTTTINFLELDFMKCIAHPWKETGFPKGLSFCQDLTAEALIIATVKLNLVLSLPVAPVLPRCIMYQTK